MIKKHENKIASKRQNVVRLDISSRKYEESQSAVLKEKRDNEVKRMFNVWRKEANKIGFIKRKGF